MVIRLEKERVIIPTAVRCHRRSNPAAYCKAPLPKRLRQSTDGGIVWCESIYPLTPNWSVLKRMFTEA